MANHRRAKPRRASYRQAIDWIADNDDTEWLRDLGDEVIPSVTASLMADVFLREIEAVVQDLRRALKRRTDDR